MSRKRNNNGRDRSGRFVFGNRIGKGRKHDSENKTTADIRALRERIVASWDRCGGDKLLARIAKQRPLDYVRLLVGLLPREGVSPAKPFIVADPTLHSPGALSFISYLEGMAGGGEVQPHHVEEALIRYARGETLNDDDTDNPA